MDIMTASPRSQFHSLINNKMTRKYERELLYYTTTGVVNPCFIEVVN